MNFHQLKMSPKEVARLIHEKIALLLQAARRKFSPNAIDYTPSDVRTSYIDDTPNSWFDETSIRCMIWGNIVGHLGVRWKRVFWPADVKVK
jgi:hypothetical protein